jgi:TolB-like protein/Tfp pilus assembly protein PilF
VADLDQDLNLQIAHVLFIDVVAYSRLLINEQRDIQQQLNQVVRATAQFRSAESERKLVRLPTGDGMALVFFTNLEAPMQCAVEIGEASKSYPQLQLRMGIHSGPVSDVADVNDRSNIAGAGLNTAMRVMSCGDAGHILLSKRAADDLAQYRQWQPHLHEVGECKVKHGAKLAVVNFYNGSIGNPSAPKKFRQLKAASRRNVGLFAAMVVLIAFGTVFWVSRHWSSIKNNLTAIIPEKSIAVLPFESYSDVKENEYFADGIQDDILTNLAKVADIKVISRTSVMKYRGAAQDLREIGRTLQVAHVLEGSVRRSGGRLRINAQLIDTRTDAHLWAEQYERDLSDIFAIQTELAQKIVAHLKANLSPSERAAIEEKPTANLEAYDFYLRGKGLMNNLFKSNDPHADLFKALELFNEAIGHDRDFALAYCEIARTSIGLYWWWGFAADDLARADTAVQTALRLAPNLGEAYIRQGQFYYQGHRNYDKALKALSTAEQLLPNSSLVFVFRAPIERRKGNWDEAVRSGVRTLELDPLKEGNYYDLIGTYKMLHNYSEAERVVGLGLSKIPEAGNLFRLERAKIAFSRGDTKACRMFLQSVSKDYRGNYWLARVALVERDFANALTLLGNISKDERDADIVVVEAMILRRQGDAAKAQAILVAERERLQNQKMGEAGDAQKLSFLALLDAALGRKQEALLESQQAIDKLPISRDAVDGPVIATRDAEVSTLVGDRNRAIEKLSEMAKISNGPSIGDLLDPIWDDIRGDSRFEKIVAAVKTASK